jgi:hypothetical protein
MLKPEEAFNQIATRARDVITAEIYARVARIPMLAHYTSLDAFGSILRTRELWFSLIRDTNDTSEVIESTEIITSRSRWPKK